MLIDWFTVFAQIVNFLVLLLLLRRFLYAPILQAMATREAKIAAQIERAESLEQVAQQEAEFYRDQNEDLQNRRDELLFLAKENAEAWRKEQIQKARLELEELRTRWYQNVEAEKGEFLQELRQRITQQVYAISRRALADLANDELEQRMIGLVLRRIQNLDASERQAFADSIQRSGNRIVFRTAFAVGQGVRREITETVQTHLSPDADLYFETAPELLCGIEAKIQDNKLAWTLDDYLESLEAAIFDALYKEGQSV